MDNPFYLLSHSPKKSVFKCSLGNADNLKHNKVIVLYNVTTLGICLLKLRTQLASAVFDLFCSVKLMAQLQHTTKNKQNQLGRFE